MPLSHRLTTTQSIEMIIVHMIAYVKVFSKPIAFGVAGFAVAWFNDFILLQVEDIANVDFVMPVAKVLSSVVALTLSGLSGWYAYGKFKNTNQDQYKSNVDWLLEKGYITKKSTASEIKAVMKEHFG